MDKENNVQKIEKTVEKDTPTALQPKLSKQFNGKETGILAVLLIAMLVASVVLFRSVIRTGANAVADGFNSEFTYEKESAYQAQYQKYYNAAEAANHVSNHAYISVGNIQEEERLEVLKVSDVEFIVEDSGNNAGNITSWLEVPGEGVFVVDLSAAEFIVDNERAYILARIPYPELTNVSIDYSNVKKVLFKDDIFNGSYKQGEDLARRQLSEADVLIKREFASNERFFLTAQRAAVSTIECLIRQFNPTVEDLKVEIEFY